MKLTKLDNIVALSQKQQANKNSFVAVVKSKINVTTCSEGAAYYQKHGQEAS